MMHDSGKRMEREIKFPVHSKKIIVGIHLTQTMMFVGFENFPGNLLF
jgi:hypothetical protein